MARSPIHKERSLLIGRREVGRGAPTYVLAEMACAHEGDPDKARALMDVAAEAQPDGVQLQIFTVSKLVSPLLPGYSDGKRLELSGSVWRELIRYASSKGSLDVWANVFDEGALELAMECGVAGLKLHSSDLCNPRMLDAVSLASKPLALAVGGSHLDEIAFAVHRLRDRGVENMILMHGFQAYPTAPEDGRLGYIQTLERLFGLPVGYMDHTDGGLDLAITLPVVAIGFGACLLEKHFTLDRSLKGIDYQASLDPKDFKRLVELVRSTDKAIGDGGHRPLSEQEEKYRRVMKKVILASRDLARGERVDDGDLVFLRSSSGLSPSHAETLIGMTTSRDIRQYEPVGWEDVNPPAE